MADLVEEILETLLQHTLRKHLAPLWEALHELRNEMTSAQDTLAQYVSQINDETNLIAQRVDDLLAQVSNQAGGVTADQLSAALGPISECLKGIGADGSANVPTDDPTTATDPTNSPSSTSPVVNPAPDAPTDEPTPDPTVNPVDVPADSLPADNSGDSAAANDASTPTGPSPENGGNLTPGASVNSTPTTDTSSTTSSGTTTDTSSTPAPDSTQPSNPPESGNTNDFREEL